VKPTGYGRVTSLAIDPVEKKPLARWMPGSTVLSLGGYGCNLRCPWCQNYGISQVGDNDVAWREVLPRELVDLAVRAHNQDSRMVGVAYTYNEPLVCWEYVRDCCELVREAGLSNVLVSAGCVN
jgi:pyruvate formate lyase activating enzyme